MRYLITFLFAALSLNAVGQSNPNYNPDYDANGSISVNDLLGFLSIFGDTWDSGDVILGCTYSNATDYNPLATMDDGSCTFLPDCAGDECGVCGGSGIADGACDCDGNVLDECGVCGGDNSTCTDCCGVVNGDGSTCDGACGACNDDTSCLDDCGVPNGDNSCLDDCGVPNGDNSTCLDECGVVNGDNSTCLDECGVPNGDNSTCFTGCGDGIMHDGHDYSTVQIGVQCWFSENCRYLPAVSPSNEGSDTAPYYYVYGYQGTDVTTAQATSNYSTYGVLYNWTATITDGLCPSGWHVPSDGEFTLLTDYLGGEFVAGDAIKSTSGWSENGNGSNSSGFTGLPGGNRDYDGNFFSINDEGYFYSSSAYGGSRAWSRLLNDNDSNVESINDKRRYGMSVRCLQDYTDECGVPNGDNSTCLDCCGIVNGDGSTCDGACGACGDDTSCLDECGVPNGDNSCLDDCGVPNGDNSTCLDECGVPNGDNSCLDECGVPNGDNSTCLDECGVVNGDGSTCIFESCGDEIGYGNYAYSTVQIDDKCWFAENCRYLPSVSPSSSFSETTPYYYVYDYQGTDVAAAQATINYETYGVLYNWPAIMTEDICPSGWHVPSDGEFTQLTDYLGGNAVAGAAMKSATAWDGTNSSSFNGLPAGFANSNGFYLSGSNGYWWSSSASGSADAWFRLLVNNNDGILRADAGLITGYSARCVRDYTDECGVLNGDNSTCLDECGVLNGDNSCLDECGVLNGDNSTCLDECGVPNGNNSTCLDCCGVVNGDGTSCDGACGSCGDDNSCLDDCGVPNGDNSTCLDDCGVPNGDNSTCLDDCGVLNGDNSCLDECGVPNGDNSTCLDECGVPNGDNSTCGCDGVPNYVISHDGYDYSTFQIGDQCWFAENCRYLPEVSPSGGSDSEELGSTTDPYYYVYGYEGTDVTAAKSTDNYETYGVLYNWPAVMTEGICPSGWHIPSDEEWQTMEMSLGMSQSEAAFEGHRGSPVGDYMKSTSGWSSGGNGSNSSGFTGLPGGYRYSGGFSGAPVNGYAGLGYWWSASESGSTSWSRMLYGGFDKVGRDADFRSYGFSARCVRD